jgi:hypothetical protein
MQQDEIDEKTFQLDSANENRRYCCPMKLFSIFSWASRPGGNMQWR